VEYNGGGTDPPGDRKDPSEDCHLAGRPGSLLQCQGGAGKLSDGAGDHERRGRRVFYRTGCILWEIKGKKAAQRY